MSLIWCIVAFIGGLVLIRLLLGPSGTRKNQDDNLKHSQPYRPTSNLPKPKDEDIIF